jgi:N-acetylglutamate synthase-like GNAT family acetyltransferase
MSNSNTSVICITTDISKIDILFVHDYLANHSYWARGIPLETVCKSIEHSLCFAVLKDDAMIGFARMITDKATFCYLCDVFIIEDQRGKGYSKMLMQTIMAYPELQGLRRYMLATFDAHGLYRQFGFEALSTPERIMEIQYQEVYAPNE